MDSSNNDYDVTIKYWSRIPSAALNIKYTNNKDNKKTIDSVFEFDLKSNSDSNAETFTFSLSDFLAHFDSDFQVEFQLKCTGAECEEYFKSSFALSISKPEKPKSKFSILNSHEFLNKLQNSTLNQWKSLANHFDQTKLQFVYNHDGNITYNVLLIKIN